MAPPVSTPPVASSTLERVEAPLPLPNPRDQAVFTRPLPTCAVLERLKQPFTDCDILSGYEDDVTTRNDSFTSWARIKPEDLLALHMVDAHRAAAEYREASERKPDSPSSVHQTDARATSRSAKQKRLSVYNWNPGPRRGDQDPFVKQIAGKWHIITLQEAPDYVDHDILTNRFHVSHFGGRAVLFKKDTFYAEVEVNSIYLHDTRRGLHDQAAEGGQGWVLQGVLARAAFRRRPDSGQNKFTVLCLHICNVFAKNRGIAKKLILAIRAIMTSQQVDLVAGDFNGTAWRSSSRNNISTIEETFLDCLTPTPPGPTPLGGPGSLLDLWADVCGFLKPPGSDRSWKVRKHGAFSIPRQALGLRKNDQSCHHERWLHLDLIDWDWALPRFEEPDQRIQLEDRSTPYCYGHRKRDISDIMSDNSFSS